ncbi:hypothetical protein [Halorhabdus amylolytica]|uniref:hypothetical protein n=1 Tax=Halorhabdus amylolytica TaxID=2559573 RepID=UPI0010AA03B9|nr:hypothetical protein [Halorhabdus amylolytica]
MDYRRRTVLRGLGLAGVGTATLTAGCLDEGLSGVMGDGYAAWIPSPAELATVERFNLLWVDPQSLRETDVVSRPVETHFTAAIERALDLLGVSFDDLTGVAWVGHFAVVFEGSFRPDRIADRFDDADFRSIGSHGAYTLYADRETLVAVSDEAIVFGPWAGDGTAGVVEAVVDARDGNRERYAAADATFADLTEALGGGDVVVARTGADVPPIERVEAIGATWRFDEGAAKVAFAFVFPAGATVRTDPIAELIHGDEWAAFEDLDVGRRGRVGIVTATVPTLSDETFTPIESIEEAAETRPTATFEATYGSERRTATIIHAAGDAIPRSRLLLQGEGFRPDPNVDQDEPGRWAEDPSGLSTAVEPGDSITVGIYPGATIELRYRPIGRGEVETLRTFEVA